MVFIERYFNRDKVGLYMVRILYRIHTINLMQTQSFLQSEIEGRAHEISITFPNIEFQISFDNRTLL